MAKRSTTRTKRATKKKAPTRTRRAANAGAVTNRICNLIPSKDTEDDWRFEDALGSGVLGAVAALPASVDLRKPWWNIGDQQATGSCVGWATGDGVVRYHMVTAGRLPQNQLLSPRYVWMASKETDEFVDRPSSFIEGDGTSLKAAMDVCRKYGTVTMDMLPFQINMAMYGGPPNTFYAAASQRRVTAYFNLLKNFAQWKTWLATHGPILVGLSVDHTWDNATATHGNLDVFMPNTVRGGHAVAVVGYLANGRFILRNSWNTTWGDKGFAYASQAYISAAFFNESYGVTI